MSEFIKTNLIAGKGGQVGVIYLDRPDTLNALNHEMINCLKDQLMTWRDDDSIKLVFIHGNGRAFCAGGDIRSIYQNGSENTDASVQFFRDEYSLNQLIHHYPKPYVSYLDGITMGGGVGISLHGSHRIASPSFLFAMPETNIGFFPDIGARYELCKLPHYMGLYLALSGNSIKAKEALDLGIATHIAEANQAEKIIQALAISTSVDETLDQFQIDCDDESTVDTTTLNCYAYKSLPEIVTALHELDTEKSKSLHDDLLKKSAFSLQTTFPSYLDAIGEDFDKIIEQDLEISKRCLSHPDFYEGIRAMLVDKDKQPNWVETLSTQGLRTKTS